MPDNTYFLFLNWTNYLLRKKMIWIRFSLLLLLLSSCSTQDNLYPDGGLNSLAPNERDPILTNWELDLDLVSTNNITDPPVCVGSGDGITLGATKLNTLSPEVLFFTCDPLRASSTSENLHCEHHDTSYLSFWRYLDIEIWDRYQTSLPGQLTVTIYGEQFLYCIIYYNITEVRSFYE